MRADKQYPDCIINMQIFSGEGNWILEYEGRTETFTIKSGTFTSELSIGGREGLEELSNLLVAYRNTFEKSVK